MRKVVMILTAMAFTACGAEIGRPASFDPNDNLSTVAQRVCGDSLVLRVDGLGDDEAVCCFVMEEYLPKLTCFTNTGAQVVNPQSRSKLAVKRK